MSIRRSLCVAAALTVLASCGEESTQPSSTTVASTSVTASAAELVLNEPVPTASAVGTVEGTDAYVAVVDRGEDLTVYVCDSAGLALWFTAERSGTGFIGEHPNGSTVEVQSSAAGYDGLVVIDGTSHAFSAASAAFPSGLWEGFDGLSADAPIDVAEVGRYGWIVLADGTQRGAKTTLETTSGAGTVDPDTGTGDGGQVPATPTPPPPTTSTLTAEKCADIKSLYFKVDLDLADEDTEKRKKMLRSALAFLKSQFTSGGCSGAIWP